MLHGLSNLSKSPFPQLKYGDENSSLLYCWEIRWENSFLKCLAHGVLSTNTTLLSPSAQSRKKFDNTSLTPSANTKASFSQMLLLKGINDSASLTDFPCSSEKKDANCLPFMGLQGSTWVMNARSWCQPGQEGSVRLARVTESTNKTCYCHWPKNAQGHHPRAPDSRREWGGWALAYLSLVSPLISAP